MIIDSGVAVKHFNILIITLFLAFNINAKEDILSTIDKMYSNDMYIEGLDLLNSSVLEASERQLVEIYWRLSMFTMKVTSKIEENSSNKDEILSGYNKGGEYASRAVELDSNSIESYFYRAANMGLWGETENSIKSLSVLTKVKDDLGLIVDLESDHGDSWYALAKLYGKLPKWPISFGDNSFAVSLSRKSLEHQGDFTNYTYYMELANNLSRRNWSMKKRNSEIPKMSKKYKKEKNILNKYCYYEGNKGLSRTEIYYFNELQALSDLEEATIIYSWILKSIESDKELEEYYYDEAAENLARLNN